MDHIERISVTAHGTLLASRFGLLETDSSAGIIRPFRPMVGAVPDELRSSTITFITPIDARHTWVGTWRSGVFEIGPDASVRSLDSALGPRSSSRMLLSCASNGNDIWLGFNNGDGLCRIRNGRVVERLLDQPDPDGMAYGVVRSLALDRSGNLYIGTLMGGLGIRDARSGAIQWFTRSDGVAGDRIEELVIDTNGGLWIRTAQGVCRMDLRTRTIQPVDLPTSIRGEHMIECLALDTDGAMLMGCGSVIVRYPPVAFGALAAPAVHVTGLWAGGHAFGRWSPDSVITLPPDQRTLSVECGVASFFDPSGVRFAYRLQDADTTWIALGEHARCDLGDLPIGQHTLQLRANNGGTRWSAEPLTLRLEVLPPFWATWWFRFTALFIIVSASITGFRIYLRERLREQREGLEREQAILAERVRIASDMHDDLGAGLSALKLRSEMALRVEQDPLKREHLGSLARSAGELISSMRQIIWTMNHDQADLADLFAYAGSYARMYCEEHGLKMDIITRSGVKQVRLTSEQRRNIFLTVKEALHNVVKHAGARSVHMTMAGEPGQLSVVIEDDGTGLPSNAADGLGNGLRNMHNRIRSLGGQLEVSAGAVRGTRVRFTVPLATASTEGSIAAMDQRDHLRGA